MNINSLDHRMANAEESMHESMKSPQFRAKLKEGTKKHYFSGPRDTVLRVPLQRKTRTNVKIPTREDGISSYSRENYGCAIPPNPRRNGQVFLSVEIL